MKLKIGDKVRIKTDEDMTLYKIMAIDKDAYDNEYVAYMVGVYDETDYSDASWYEDELIFVGRASENKEPELTKREDTNTYKITLDDVKTFAEWQTDIQAVFGASLISFDFEGIAVTNPWVDETGRFELSNKQAIRVYGVKNYTKFIKEAIKALKCAKENGYKL